MGMKLKLLGAASLLLSFVAPATAQNFPDHTVKVIVFTPTGDELF